MNGKGGISKVIR